MYQPFAGIVPPPWLEAALEEEAFEPGALEPAGGLLCAAGTLMVSRIGGGAGFDSRYSGSSAFSSALVGTRRIAFCSCFFAGATEGVLEAAREGEREEAAFEETGAAESAEDERIPDGAPLPGRGSMLPSQTGSLLSGALNGVTTACTSADLREIFAAATPEMEAQRSAAAIIFILLIMLHPKLLRRFGIPAFPLPSTD